MDPVTLARIQFGLTIGFHYIFPSITIGMAWVIVWMMWRALRTGEPTDRTMARFWVRIFALTFAIGVATGVTMEFQFGTNWASYSRYVGDIFGAPLAAEGLFAFFLESSFLGLLLFGEKRIGPRMHLVSALMVAIGSTLSAFWIVAANSWQQTPAGFRVTDGRAELTDFGAALWNHSTLPRFLHTVDSALMAGSFFVLGISAYYVLKGRHLEVARRSARIALAIAVVASVGQVGLGHWHGVQVARTQPAKLAAFEALFETTDDAPIILFGVVDEEAAEVRHEVAIPGLLSLMVGNSRDTVVQGLNDFPREDWPPVVVTSFTFHLMFMLGVFFAGWTSLGVLLLWRKKLFDPGSRLGRLYLWGAVLALPLPVVASELGWMSAEMGRQPWVVWGLLRTRDAVSITVSPAELAFSIAMFSVVYALLFAVWIFLLRKKIGAGPEPAPADAAHAEEVRP